MDNIKDKQLWKVHFQAQQPHPRRVWNHDFKFTEIV